MRVKMKRRKITACLRSGEKVAVPAWELDGGTDGPRLMLLAAQHGNEVQGSEAIRQFVDIAAHGALNGKVFAVPFANLPAIRERRPHIRMKPEQAYGDDRGHNMNRTWPGNPRGNDTARLSHAIYQSFGDEATHCFDFHCWERHAAPALLIREAPNLRELAQKIAHRFVRVSKPNNITVSGYFCSTGRVGLTYEFSGQYVINHQQIKLGLRVLMNYAKLIGLLPGRLQKGFDPVLFSDETDEMDVLAPRSGLFVAEELRTCDYVSKGTVLGRILSDMTLKCDEVLAPRAGYLRAFGASRPKCDVAMPGHHPYVTKGERLATIVWQKKRS